MRKIGTRKQRRNWMGFAEAGESQVTDAKRIRQSRVCRVGVSSWCKQSRVCRVGGVTVCSLMSGGRHVI